jgi:uncharacterized protein (DUF2141 family)
MHKQCKLTFIGALLLLILSVIAASAQNKPPADAQGTTYTLSIHMTGFRSAVGAAGVLVFCSPKGWPESNADACEHKSVPIENGEATIKFDGLKAGTYAAVALHDENMNKKLDRNFLGIPKEGFGFPNNIKVGLRPPSYEAASFKVDGDTAVEIKIQYK